MVPAITTAAAPPKQIPLTTQNKNIKVAFIYIETLRTTALLFLLIPTLSGEEEKGSGVFSYFRIERTSQPGLQV